MTKQGLFFVLLTLFGVPLCLSTDVGHDLRFKQEVDDFEEFLRQKITNEPDPHNQFAFEESEEDSHEYPHGYPDDEGEQGVFRFHTIMKNLLKNNPHTDGKDPHQTIQQEDYDSSNLEKNLPYPEPVKRHYPVEEILFIRRAETEANDPIAEVVEKLVNDRPTEEHLTSHHDVVSKTEDSVSSPMMKEATTEDVCPSENFTSNLYQTCTEGPQYELQLPPNFSEILKQDMEKMLQTEDRQHSKCNYRKRLGPNKGAEDRGLCPFEWTISARNPSRIPEYLYEARCSCQVSRKIRRRRFKCIELKRVIPVLWIVNCSGGKRKYKQGWQEISVACVPLEERQSKLVELDPMF